METIPCFETQYPAQLISPSPWGWKKNANHIFSNKIQLVKETELTAMPAAEATFIIRPPRPPILK